MICMIFIDSNRIFITE
ncbi:hypothetical protein, partial [Plasmodium yoelii yoelii]